jgi:two-component system sensor histidine kinase PilS (NtrC family)
VVELSSYLETFASEFSGNEHVDRSVLEVHATRALHVQFDRSHLNQVMWNLCRNALRHGRQVAGSIRIVARPALDSEPGGNACVDVIDDGDGIAPGIQAQLFEPFFTTVSSGTGLGLYLARELADANGATLEFTAGPPPTRFTLHCKAASMIPHAAS